MTSRNFMIGGLRLRRPPVNPFRYLAAPTSFWYQRLADNASLHADSSFSAPNLARQLRYSTSTVPRANFSPPYQTRWHQSSSFSPSLWVVDSSNISTVSMVRVQLLGQNTLLPLPDSADTGLGSALASVPLPSDPSLTLMSSGSDAGCCVYDAHTDTVYEYWRLRKNYTDAAGTFWPWACSYAGIMTNASTQNGIFPNSWGQSACGRVQSVSLVKLDEVASLHIPHMVTCGLPSIGSGVYAPFYRHDSGNNLPGGSAGSGTQPTLTTTTGSSVVAGATTLPFAAVPFGYLAGRSWDINVGQSNAETVVISSFTGTTANLAAPTTQAHAPGETVSINPRTDQVNEGAIFRFPANIIIPSVSTHFTPITQALMVAIRDYGLLIGEGSGIAGFSVEATNSLGSIYSSHRLLSNPFDETAELNSKSLQNIPWEQLQQIAVPT